MTCGKINYSVLVLTAIFCCHSVFAHGTDSADSTGLDGDNFSLEAALSLFQDAKGLEDFEKQLNDYENQVNNLDLNNDGEVDYIRVVDNMDGNVHAIVLQAPVSETESQDIAVIEIEKTGNEEAILQIIGDPLLYSDNYILEPYDEETKGTGKGGPSVDVEVSRIVVNVWFWHSVRVLYGPKYRPWVSPWRWGYYPPYWQPWRPKPWRAYHTHVVVYRHRPYHRVTTHRVVNAHKVYTPNRKTSTAVVTRSTRTVTGPGGKATRTTTKKKVTGPRGNTAGVKKSRATVKNKKTGNKRTKTTKKRGG